MTDLLQDILKSRSMEGLATIAQDALYRLASEILFSRLPMRVNGTVIYEESRRLAAETMTLWRDRLTKILARLGASTHR